MEKRDTGNERLKKMESFFKYFKEFFFGGYTKINGEERVIIC